jgi:hypothetical protein
VICRLSNRTLPAPVVPNTSNKKLSYTRIWLAAMVMFTLDMFPDTSWKVA